MTHPIVHTNVFTDDCPPEIDASLLLDGATAVTRMWGVTFFNDSTHELLATLEAAVVAVRDLIAANPDAPACVTQPRCTGFTYLVNDDAPDEGSDVHHEGPCPVHPGADQVGPRSLTTVDPELADTANRIAAIDNVIGEVA